MIKTEDVEMLTLEPHKGPNLIFCPLILCPFLAYRILAAERKGVKVENKLSLCEVM